MMTSNKASPQLWSTRVQPNSDEGCGAKAEK